MSDIERNSPFRIPTSPYPGLRPFLDHEAGLLLGREQQVKEVIERLCKELIERPFKTHFVAVIGGSGSGKSSLVRAGVVPELRGYGIPDAGDYWIPVIVTPGTTEQVKVSEGRGHADDLAIQTPITRLAWKFSQQLDPADQALRRRLLQNGEAETAENIDSEQECRRRLDEIARAFRQEPGFARLVDAYTEDLPAVGPDRKDARFLFVIDQFEELFHINNKGSKDTEILIEAVIDHFFNPHPRCYVILTMRSEYLAACAGYLELPDAINESVYLVRRLDESELRDAIVGPAEVYLRLLQRGDGDVALPDDVVFDEEVIRRLLTDVEQIASDPDHLPLLQHLLARIWQVASVRCGVDGEHSVPGEIRWCDLERATDPAGAPGWLRQKKVVNVLRESLDRWAASIYNAHNEDQRKLLDDVLRRLAFKDPNDGTYNQQRLDVNDPGLLDGDAQRQNELRKFLEVGYLDSVHYLHWDKENPARVTLKVSHESFIRGWSHFRGLIDEEAERFEEFLTVLRRCTDWLEAVRHPELLLGQAELIRLDAAGLGTVLTQPDQREDWFLTLKQFRDGDRHSIVKAEVAEYIASSRALLDAKAEATHLLEERARKAQEDARLAEEREKQAEWRREAEAKHRAEETAREDRARKRKRWVISGAFLVLVALIFGAIPFVATYPILGAVEKFGMARIQVDQSNRDSSAPIAGDSKAELHNLLMAANIVAEGKRDSTFLRGRIYNWFNGFFQVALAKRLAFLQDTEPYVNGNLRQRLTTGIWPSDTDPEATASNLERFDPVKPEYMYCTIQASDKSKSVPGFVYPGATRGRGIFVPKRDRPEWQDIELYPAKFENKDQPCVAGRIIGKATNSNDAYVLFDSRLSYMAVSQRAAAEGLPSVTLFKVNWDDDEKLPSARLELVTQVFGIYAVDSLRKEKKSGPKQLGDPKVKSVVSWREVGGMGVRVAGQSWRLFASGAQRIRDPGDEKDWKPLAMAQVPSACDSLKKALLTGVPPGIEVDMYQDGKHCFQIQTPKPTQTPSPKSSQKPDVVSHDARANSQQPNIVRVNVYDEPISIELLEQTIPSPIANFSRFASAKCLMSDWKIGVHGRYEGWLSASRNCRDEVRRVGAPWSTAALVKLGQEILSTTAAQGATPEHPQ